MKEQSYYEDSSDTLNEEDRDFKLTLQPKGD